MHFSDWTQVASQMTNWEDLPKTRRKRLNISDLTQSPPCSNHKASFLSSVIYVSRKLTHFFKVL